MKYPDDFMNKIICGDCLEVMKNIPDNSVDMVLTSPPYDKLRTYNGYSFNFETIANEIIRILSIGGVLVWVVGDSTIKGSETGNSFRQALFFMQSLLLHDTMIYEKAGNAFPSNNRYNQIFEYMFVFSKGKPKTINLIKDKKNAWGGQTSFGNSSNRQKNGDLKVFGKKKIKEYGLRNNIWRFAGGYSHADKLSFKHPATFPPKLAEDHIITWSNPDDIVLDPLCGSGTTCKMAKKLNRNYIGIDISEEYVNLANQRLAEI